MAIDPSQVQWDAPSGPIDPNQVQWDTPTGNYRAPDLNAPLQNSPLSPGSAGHNWLTGEIEAGNSMRSGILERYYQLTGQQDKLTQMQSQIASDRQLFAPANATTGAKVGSFMGNAAPAAAAMAIPGMQGYGGALLTGALSGAMQPTTQNESALANTIVGGTLAPISKFGGDLVGGALMRALTNRAANTALASAVGSNASKLNGPAIAENDARLSGIFNAVRSPNVSADLSQAGTGQLVDQTGSQLGGSARQAFEANPDVQQLLDTATSNNSTLTGKQLGDLSTRLRQESSQQLSSENGNRPLGFALQSLKEHVDDVLGSTIQDPQLAAQYSAARGQYGLFQDASTNPTLLNPTTGRAKMLNIANYLNRNTGDFADASNTSPLYQAAHMAQGMSDEGKVPPKFDVTNLALPWLGYKIGQNFGEAGARTATTAAALAPISAPLRYGLPVSRGLRYGLPGLALGAQGTLLPYLEQ